MAHRQYRESEYVPAHRLKVPGPAVLLAIIHPLILFS